MLKLMVTGHREESFSLEQRDAVQSWLHEMAQHFAKYNYTTAISGMATGVDMWWAEAGLEAGMKLEAHVPFWRQPKRWRIDQQHRWRGILMWAEDVVVYGRSDPYRPQLFFLRNEGMVVECDLALVVWDGRESGGTYHAVNCLKAEDKPYVWYNPVTGGVFYSWE